MIDTIKTTMEQTVKNKRILFFAPSFFDYEKVIADKYREFGAEVDLFDERSVTSAWERALLKISPLFFRAKTERYYNRIIQNNKKKDYDYILIIKCDMISPRILLSLRKTFPNARLCLYMYDSIKNVPGIASKFRYFDTVSSFDLEDCEKHKELRFRPLFYGDQFRSKKKEHPYRYDISFIGTIHSDRYSIIKNVEDLAKNRNLETFWYLYLQSRFMYFFYKLTKREFKDTDSTTFDYEKMPAKNIAEVVEDSRIILDIQHPKQTGLTMRTIEMIGMNKKLITTNESITKYDFYNPDNIAVIDRKNIDIPIDFLEKKYCPIPEAVYNRYSLSTWALEVLN